ncbi:macrophage metalloelastase-like [Lytechinus pictus]|uniref:macrophage metalloelastase-like n=1 Tax=Lytechinus pictus TaxID=7653 RepID=UPI0030BA0DB8
MFLVPSTVLGQFWQNTQGNSFPDYGNYPQYQGTSASDSMYGGQQNGQQSQGQGQTSNIDIDVDDDMDPEDVAFFKDYLQIWEYVEGAESPEELREAVMRLQRMAGVEPTGILNNQTLARIKNAERCGNKDKKISTDEMRKRRYAIQHGWSKKKLTWAIKNYTPDVAKATTIRVLTSAFQVWGDVARLDFAPTRFPKADIIVLFARANHGDGYAFDGPGGTLAHAYFPGEGIGGDVHFDEDETFSDKTRQGTNLFIVAAHEIGHSLGLAHSEVSKSLMAPYYQGFQPNFRLNTDDVRGIQSLYGARSTPPNRPRPPGGPTVPDNGPRDRRVCNAQISAVTFGQVVGHQVPSLFIFSGEQFWIKKGNEPVSNALQTEAIFTEMQSIPDAAFIRNFRGQRRMIFFSGTEIWEFSQGAYQPRDIRERTGIRTNGIDAAFKWARNNRIYVFYRGLYWRLNEQTLRADRGYPRPIKDNWRGRSGPFDAAWTEGKGGVSHFLINKQVSTFKDNEVFFVAETRSFASDWLICGQNIGSGVDGPIRISGILLIVSFLMTIKRVL